MKRSKHSLSHYKLFSCDMGELIPCSLVEVLPGDSIQQATSILIRVSPLLAPVMHPVHVRVHHWYVPHRIVWDDFEDFITGGADGMDSTVFPTVNAGGDPWGEGTLADYLGLPTGISGHTVSALPFRGYGLIWNEYYRDQDLQTELTIGTGSGADTTTNVPLQSVGWEKDYFTTSRPWTQKGPDVSLSLSGDAPITGLGAGTNVSTPATSPDSVRETKDDATYPRWWSSPNVNLSWQAVQDDDSNWRPNIYADLSGVSAVDVNELRKAFALQRYEEARARYGSRYIEYLRYLGVRSSDARLQRPEYLGGGKQTIQFSEVLQTGLSSADSPVEFVGTMRGHGIGALRTNRYRRFFEEHGYVFSLLSVRPKSMYVQSLPRTWSRRSKEDFWQRELEHIGQQEVYKREVHGGDSKKDEVFGYQDRYDEYRRMESSVAGEFRGDLDFWHYARKFGSDVALNADFVQCMPTKRTNAVTDNDVLWVMANHSIQARRLVSKKGSTYAL